MDDDAKYEGPWVSEVSREEVVSCYTDWEPEVQELLQVRIAHTSCNLEAADGKCSQSRKL